MSGEIIAILSVGIGLGLLSTGLFAWLRTDLVKVEERLRGNTVKVEERLRADMVKGEERLRTDMVKGEERLRADLVTVEERLRGNLVTVEERLRADLVTVEERLRGNLVTVEEHLRADIKQLANRGRAARIRSGQAGGAAGRPAGSNHRSGRQLIRVFCRIQRTDAASGEKCGRALPRGPSLPRGLWSGG